MKNIVKFQIVKPQGNVTVDAYNPMFQELELDDIFNMLLPYSRLFERIIIKNFTTVPEKLLQRLTNQYLHGATIQFITPTRQFDKEFKVVKPRPFFSYKWQPLDLSAPIPKSLANFTFEYQGKTTTYLNAIKSLTTTRFLPNEIWTALDVYSQQQIAKCREFNQGNYNYAELWYKELMKDAFTHKFKVFSPNKKTYFEAMAEVNFDKDLDEVQLQKGLRPLNQDELLFLTKFAPAYGVEVPRFQWRINTRKTDHGYTEEPERVTGGMSNADWNRVLFDPRNQNLPNNIRQNLTVREYDNDKLLRDAYFQLKWLIKHLKDDALMPNWKRCPVCHELYKESEGCSCGACTPITYVQADNLFYGDAGAYEDYEDTRIIYDDLADETEGDELIV